MAYEYDPRRRRRGRVPPQLRAWVFGRRRRARARRTRYDPDPVRRRRYRGRRRYDPTRRAFRRPGLWGILSKLAGFGVFVEQVTEKDRGNVGFGYQGMSLTDKAKFLVGILSQRIAGIRVLGVAPIVPRTLNPVGILNKWLGLGILLNIIGLIPGIPMRGRMKSFGRWIAIGGGLGGLFDQPALQRPEYSPAIAGAPRIPSIVEQRSVWS